MTELKHQNGKLPATLLHGTPSPSNPTGNKKSLIINDHKAF